LARTNDWSCDILCGLSLQRDTDDGRDSQETAEELDTVDWRAIRTQLRRDSVILVDPELDLIEVAWCVANDRSAEVARLDRCRQLRKPTAAELAAWERDLDKPFRMSIVAPYLLVQVA